MPLYGELEGAAQDAALSPAAPGQRKIVLATSIAETSLTIEGIRVVVDSGLRRYAEFDPQTGMSRLVTAQSVASRGGSTPRPRRPPERRALLSALVGGHACVADAADAAGNPACGSRAAGAGTQLLGRGRCEQSRRGSIRRPRRRWRRRVICCVSSKPSMPAARVTPHGRRLAKLGMHPRLAHMLVKARELGATRLACDLAAILSERDILRAGAGARDADLRLRVAVLRGDERDVPPGITVDSRAKAQAQRSSAHWQREFCARGARRFRRSARVNGASVGLGLSGSHRPQARGDGGRYLLANGRGARFAEPQALAKSEFIVAAELDGAEREARIFLAAPLRPRRSRGAFRRADARARRDSLGRAASSSSARGASAVSAPCCWNRPRCAIPTRTPCSSAALTGLRQVGLAVLPWTQGVASVAGTSHVDAAVCGADACALAGFERCGACGDSRGMGAALDCRIHSSRTFLADGSGSCAASPI